VLLSREVPHVLVRQVVADAEDEASSAADDA
jgi:hypothetical protein